ncbi:MAG TPA: hypothetical protein VH583_02625 [Vicinamibacterales bacterium]
MSGRRLPISPRALLSALGASIAFALVSIHAAPRAADARNFAGTWNYATMTPLERPRDFAERETLSVEEAAQYERQVTQRQARTNNTAGPDWWDPGTRHLTDRRTSLIVDPANGRLPPLTDEAQRRAAERAEARRRHPLPDGPEDLALNERCLQWAVAGPPMLPGVYNNNVEFIQARDAVVIVNEMIHDARVVPTDGRPHGSLPRWMGDSRGRWDGDTFIVDTVNFNDKASVRGSDAHLHLIERFTRVDADTIDYQFTVDDPTVWRATWTAHFPMHRSNERMYEYACHEGNFRSVQGILLGARTVEHDPR